MRAQFELTIDEKTGEPIIKFKHHDKDQEIYQKLLKLFVDKARENGMELKSSGGYLCSSQDQSWENYEIHAKSK